MSDFNDRVIQIAEYYGITKPADFAKKTGFSHQVASNYLKGTRIPNAEALSIIKRSFDISAEWLLTGDGDMLDNGFKIQGNDKEVIYRADPKDAEIIASSKETIETQRKLIASLESRIYELEKSSRSRMSTTGLRSVPAVDSNYPTQSGAKPK
ncbi:MAG: helix-turn-helix domain-containing protein [Rikenellaceae bacterium]